MKKIFLDFLQISKIAKNKNQLEKELDVKITLCRGFIEIEGEAIAEYPALQVIEAITLGFDIQTSLLLKDEEYILQKIQIKDYIGKAKQRLIQVKARIIGKKGKAIKTISELGNCSIKLHENLVAIIGMASDAETTLDSVISLIRGSNHSNVYARLEKLDHEEEPDLGLKDNKGNKS